MLNDTYTSTGAKFFWHEEAMKNLRNGKGQAIVTHVMLTDVCNHTCAFCSVQARAGDSLPFEDVMMYLTTLKHYGLKAVILSGGGNPILYRCKRTGKNFNHVVNAIKKMGLEMGLITNGMPLRKFQQDTKCEDRISWKGVKPETLDKLTWIRISMSGLDHDEQEVYVPELNPKKTTLGFSYVAHDIWRVPQEPHHGKVSTYYDLQPFMPQFANARERAPDWCFEERIDQLTQQITHYVDTYKPNYVRLLPNCLEPELIPRRCEMLLWMAETINSEVGYECCFVQYKPPAAPKACYLGYIHPVLNCDGYVYPCDSCVLNESADHQFANPWRICHWSEISKIYEQPVTSLIADPVKTCPGCVFTNSNELLKKVVDGEINLTPPLDAPVHANFV